MLRALQEQIMCSWASPGIQGLATDLHKGEFVVVCEYKWKRREEKGGKVSRSERRLCVYTYRVYACICACTHGISRKWAHGNIARVASGRDGSSSTLSFHHFIRCQHAKQLICLANPSPVQLHKCWHLFQARSRAVMPGEGASPDTPFPTC